jgi:hypothetical protein
MRNTTRTSCIFLSALVLVIAATAHAQPGFPPPPSTFDWVPNGPNPYDFTGSIELATPSGPLDYPVQYDILSITLSDSVSGPFSVAIPNDIIGIASPQPFWINWNPSQITSMCIYITASPVYPFYMLNPSPVDFLITQGNIKYYGGGNSVILSDSGSWLAATPEPPTIIAGALLLLPFGAGALRMLRKRLWVA